MVLPGLLIEYLISGALSLIWIIPLLNKFKLSNSIFSLGDLSNIILIGIGLYFIGMIIDIIAWSSTKSIKKKIRNQYAKRLDLKIETKKGDAYRRESKFAIYAPELAKEVAMRSSRDRVARGAIINSLFGTIAYIVIMNQILLPLIIGLCSVIICFLMWRGFEQVSYGFEVTAEEILDEKIKSMHKG